MKKIVKLIGITIATISLSACGGTGTNGNNTPATSPDKEIQTTTQNQAQMTTIEDIQAVEIKVSLDQAIAIFKGLHPNVTITDISFEKELAGYQYEIDAVDDSREYEVILDAQTENIISNRTENLDLEDANGKERLQDALDLTSYISPSEAINSAKQQQVGSARKYSIDQSRGVTHYDIAIVNGMVETEVKVDAKTGAILEVEIDD